MKKNKKINITLFTGGSGSSELIYAIKNLSLDIELNLIINGYDDGKSTGYLRNIVPGMLGPSDFRKNCSHLLNKSNLKYFLEYRIKNLNEFKKINKIFKNKKIKKDFFSEKLNQLDWKSYNAFQKLFNIFEQYIKNKKIKNFKDISFGNILFASIFLEYKKNFNLALKKYLSLFNLKNNIHNINNGENLFLCAISEDGNILRDEWSIVTNKKEYKIYDFFLLKKKLNNKMLQKINNTEKFSDKIIYLNNLNIKPRINKNLKNIIKKSNIIIFGAGTQFSSLYPTYVTPGLRNLLKNSKAKKYVILNIYKDFDIVKENTSLLIKKMNYYLNEKSLNYKNNLIDAYFINELDKDDINIKFENKYLPNNVNNSFKNIKLDWEKNEGKHLPNLILKKIFHLNNNPHFFQKNKKYTSVSIILPCLNEERTLKKVLEEISNIKLKDMNLIAEIILVDGGSTDKSVQIAKNFKNIKLYTLKNKFRGECLDYGIKKSKGDIIAIFPTDNEYQIKDLIKLIKEIHSGNSKAIYGSRLIKCLDLNKQIKSAYKNNYLGYLISKYGGMLISIFTLLLFNRYLTDPLTTIKCFDSSIYKSLNLESKGIEYELEQFVKLTKKNTYINEIPVSYKPRKFYKEKKISIIDGIKCILILIKLKFII